MVLLCGMLLLHSKIQACLLTVHALAAILAPKTYRPLALPSCPFADLGVLGAAEPPYRSRHPQPLPAGHKRAAWGDCP